jgi:rhodanese-related sulfurtransferase
MGYTNVFVYDAGLPAWIREGNPVASNFKYPQIDIALISPQDLKGLVDGGQPLSIVDIRGTTGLEAGMIKGSVSIPMVDLSRRYEEIPTGIKVVLTDLHGKQVLTAGRFLASKGYGDIHRLDGGVLGGWIKAGLPVEK